jgi:hypothetical protein
MRPVKNKHHNTLLHLADAPSPATIAMLNLQARRGWKVHLISHKAPPANYLDQRVKVHRLPISTRYPLTYLAFLVAAPIIRSVKPDLIHAHYLTRFGILAAVYRRFLRFKPMVLTACGQDVLVDARGGMTRWSAEHALKMFEVITGDCNEVIEALYGLEAPGDLIERIDWSTGANESLESAADRLDIIYTDLIRRNRD